MQKPLIVEFLSMRRFHLENIETGRLFVPCRAAAAAASAAVRAKAADLEEDELSESDDEELRKELEADAALDDEDEEDDVSIRCWSTWLYATGWVGVCYPVALSVGSAPCGSV